MLGLSLGLSDKCSNTQAKYASVYTYLKCIYKATIFLHFVPHLSPFDMLLCLMCMFQNYLMALVMIYSGVCVHGLGFLLLEHFICIFISYLFMILNL